MIIWIASYPKSGNTWLRALLSSYYYSEKGLFEKKLLNYTGQFPEKSHFKYFNYDQTIVTETSKYWIKAQKIINEKKQIRFFKTHNFFGQINGNSFTDKNNSLGCIYIIRDPRNVITSLKNHYELNYNEALNFMMSEKKYLYDYHKTNDYSDFQFISSWEKNYQSWKMQNEIPVKIIRYEDLIEKTFATFEEVLDFINSITKNNDLINKTKLKNAIKSTEFNKLKKIENTEGFDEFVLSHNKKDKINFFHLGPANDWNNLLPEELKIKLNNSLKNNLLEFNYC